MNSMSHICIYGVNFSYGYDYQNKKIIMLDLDSTQEKNTNEILNAMNFLLRRKDELIALMLMESFVYYELQGHGWRSLLDYCSFNRQTEYKKQAELALISELSSDYQKQIAQTIIDVLEGNYVFPPPPEKTAEEKAKIQFNKDKPRLRVKLTVRDGYKCIKCGHDKEDSLCVMQKTKDSQNYDLSNLELRCRKCLKKK